MATIDRFIPPSLRDDATTLRRGRIIVGSAFVLAISFLIGTAARLAIGKIHPAAAVVSALSFAAFLAMPWLLRASGSLRLTGLATVFSFTAALVGMVFLAGGLDASLVLVLPLVPFVATYLVDSRAGILAAVLISAAVLALVLLHLGGVVLPPAAEGDDARRATALVLLFATPMVAFIAVYNERQQIEAERRTKESEALYRGIFEQSKDAVILTSLDGRRIEVNQAALELYGFTSKKELFAEDAVSFYVDPGQRDSLVEQLDKEGFVKSYEMRQRRRGGKVLTIQATVSPVRDEQGDTVRMLSILRDVSEQKQAEAEREAMLAQLAEKNTELERFTYTVSHDLKSPLLTIRSFADLLRKDTETGDRKRVEEDLAQIAAATESMRQMVDDLLELSRIRRQAESWKEVSLGGVVRETLDLLAGRISKAGVEVEVEESLPRLKCDRILLRMVFQNLIDNAVKYSADTPAPRVKIGARREGRQTVYFVRDNGVGIAAEDHDKVFDLFRQLSPSQSGTGIGLTSVKRAIEVHGGRIWVESDGVGHGATFCFTLPERAPDRPAYA